MGQLIFEELNITINSVLPLLLPTLIQFFTYYLVSTKRQGNFFHTNFTNNLDTNLDTNLKRERQGRVYVNICNTSKQEEFYFEDFFHSPSILGFPPYSLKFRIFFSMSCNNFDQIAKRKLTEDYFSHSQTPFKVFNLFNTTGVDPTKLFSSLSHNFSVFRY